jgi:hypothetical protein
VVLCHGLGVGNMHEMHTCGIDWIYLYPADHESLRALAIYSSMYACVRLDMDMQAVLSIFGATNTSSKFTRSWRIDMQGPDWRYFSETKSFAMSAPNQLLYAQPKPGTKACSRVGTTHEFPTRGRTTSESKFHRLSYVNKRTFYSEIPCYHKPTISNCLPRRRRSSR